MITWIKMGFKIIITILLIILTIFAAAWLIEAVVYSAQVQSEMDGVETVCYFDRGFIKTPFVKICKTNESLTFTKKKFFED